MKTVWFWISLLFVLPSLADRYVATFGNTPDGVYSNWATAASSIQDAVNAAAAGEVIHVNDGVYYSTGGVNGAVSITKAVTLVSENGPGLTVIDGNYPTRTNRCLHMTSAGAVVDGFTIRNGCLTAGSIYGAGVSMTNGTLINCVVMANSNAVSYGAGIHLTDGLVSNCLVVSNRVLNPANNQQGGGGIYMVGRGRVEACRILANESLGSYAYGGGIYMSGGRVTNSEIALNQSTNGSGGGVVMTGGFLLDCAVVSNTGSRGNLNCYGGGVYLYSGASTVSACRVELNTVNALGGGIYSAAGFNRVEDCQILDNRCGRPASGDGGGFYANTNNLFRNCTVDRNYVSINGGGGYAMNGTVSNCVFRDNTGGAYGIGLYLNASARAFGCRIANSVSTNSAPNGVGIYLKDCGSLYDSVVEGNTNLGSRGGGIYASALATVPMVISNCLIARNYSKDYGAGICYAGGRVLVFDTVIRSNQTQAQGGGIYVAVSGLLVQDSLIWTNVANQGGGVHVQGGGSLLQNCTIANNVSTGSYGGGIMSWSTTNTLTNCVVYGNACTVAGQSAKNNWSNTATNMAWSCTTPLAGVNGSGNTGSDPLFLDPGAGNLRLKKGSPCKDAGVQQDWMAGARDLAGSPRLSGTSVDMGAYEIPPNRGALMTIR